MDTGVFEAGSSQPRHILCQGHLQFCKCFGCKNPPFSDVLISHQAHQLPPEVTALRTNGYRDITLAESVIAGCSLYWCLSLVWTITTRSGNLTWTSIGNYLMQIFYLLTKHHVRSCKDLCCPSRSSTELSALLCCPEKSFPHKMIIGKCR